MSAKGAVTVASRCATAARCSARCSRPCARRTSIATVELLVADSGSADGSAALARRLGARVLEIDPADFSHGGTRNRLIAEAAGDHVAFLTQDSVPAHGGWLAALLRGFTLADDVALACGPALPREGDSPMVRRELGEFFARFGGERVDRGVAELGPASFFSSANGAIARWAWERVPLREVPYAEDQVLARDVLAAGLAKAYVPAAAVVHSHDLPPLRRAAALLRRLPRARRGPRPPRAAEPALRGGARARRRRRRPRVHAPRGAAGADLALAAPPDRAGARPQPRRERRPPAGARAPRAVARRPRDVRGRPDEPARPVRHEPRARRSGAARSRRCTSARTWCSR